VGLFAAVSYDEGKTWPNRRLVTPGSSGKADPNGYLAATQTRGGNVVVPVEIRLHDPGRWGTYVFVSPDDGETWSRSKLIDLGGHGHHDGAIEAAITELSDNRLMLLIRTSLDRFWEAYSEDHGYHWRELRPSQVDASSAPGYLQRLASGRLVLVWNRVNREGAAPTLRSAPSALYANGSRSQREELSLSYSDDDGKNWAPGVVIARQTNGSICYPFVLEPTPGELWIWTRYGSQPPLCVSLKEQDLSAMQDAVLRRKSSGGTDSEAGSRFVERMLSVVATARQQNRNVLELLTACCRTRLDGSAAPSLLPAEADRRQLSFLFNDN